MKMSEFGKPKADQNDYEKAINALIPLAEEEAKAECRRTGKRQEKRKSDPSNRWSATFTYSFESEFFHKAINRLAFEAGLRSFQ